MISITENYQNCTGVNPRIQKAYSAKNEEEIQQALSECRNNKTPLYVHSTGNNWGYGAKSPIQEDSCVLSLAEMNQISNFDSERGIVHLQPGVTYGQLSEFLRASGNRWIAPVHGGGPDCSVMGNLLERGFGITPIEDHFSSLQSMRAILPNGKIYESSYKSLGMENLCQNFQWGIGPYMDGLFTQSNFGIVTEICIRLAPKREFREVWIVKIKPSTKWGQILKTVRKIQQDHGHSIGGINIMNKERMNSMFSDYPLDKKENSSALSQEEVQEFAKSMGFNQWTIVLSIQSTKETGRAIKKQLKKNFKAIKSSINVVNDFSLAALSLISKFIPKLGKFDFRKFASSSKGLLDIIDGIPNHTAVKLAYWMNETPFQASKQLPDIDNCGLIWFSPILPLSDVTIEMFLKICEETSAKYNINPLITLTSFNALSLECTFPILFNKNSPGAAENARKFYLEMFKKCREIHCIPYRLPIFAMEEIKQTPLQGSFLLASNIKKQLDPDNILSPGRYVF
ncbi:MAG: FAD-dependent oxidoreductase [Bdellovibrionota bacterium]|nr:FAD-dependent oxidoreductase [Bdellovibrionota bacterium]